MHAGLSDTSFQLFCVLEHIFIKFRTVFQFFLELWNQFIAVLELRFV